MPGLLVGVVCMRSLQFRAEACIAISARQAMGERAVTATAMCSWLERGRVWWRWVAVGADVDVAHLRTCVNDR
ncbi:hypothetical protein CHR55_22750 [Rhodococcus qingshengii]|uniref:Uncharacterized protein n=1 Tax=Rhodococcus qingshengii TaxID=334542 RepID=A0A2A5J7A3_RHOSG|nr:hypothetical protein CHR55_22750 [Rhodococcus qingshengii]